MQTTNRLSLAVPMAFLSASFVALAQFSFKLVSVQGAPIAGVILAPSVIIGVAIFCYVVAFYLSLVAYKYGELTIVFPLISAVSLIVSVLLAILFLKEVLDSWRILGVTLIICGAFVITRKS